MYGYNAEPPIAIPIYTVLPYCVIKCTSLEENWFTCKISGSLVLWLVCFDMDLVCIIGASLSEPHHSGCAVCIYI